MPPLPSPPVRAAGGALVVGGILVLARADLKPGSSPGRSETAVPRSAERT
jgi:hypothetical protein